MKTPHLTHSRIRWMTAKDLSRVIEIEILSFLDPLNEKTLLSLLEESKTIGFVIESCSEDILVKDRVVGYCIFRLQPYAIKILTMSVHPDFREQGFGGLLIEKIKSKLGDYRFSIHCYLAEDEVKALYFFSGRGFKPTQMIRNLWRDGFDAIRMEFIVE